MSKLEQNICQMLENGESFVLATILSRAGSTPRTAGTKMLIHQDGSIAGTIGGGLVEAEVIRSAADIFKGENARIRDFDLTSQTADSMDMICGGHLKILLEFVAANPVSLRIFGNLHTALKKGKTALLVADLTGGDDFSGPVPRGLLMGDGTVHGNLNLPESLLKTLAKDFRRERSPAMLILGNRRLLVEPSFVPGTVYVFGAGHVSQKLAVLTRMTDFRTVVLDDREEFANPERFRDADEIRVLADFEHAFSDLEIGRDSYLVIVTRGHSHDKTVLAQALRTLAGYIGMIGSRRKRETIYKALLNEGFTRDDLDRVHSPIGLSIGAETPEEIAVSIVGELISARADMGRPSAKGQGFVKPHADG